MRQISCLHKKPLDDPTTGEIVCSDCGVVLESKTSNEADPGYYKIQSGRDRTRHGCLQTNTFHEGLSTVIDKQNIDFTGKKLSPQITNQFNKLKWQDRISRFNNVGIERRRKIPYLIKIGLFTDQLGLPNNLNRNIYYIFNKCAKLGISKGRNTVNFAAACIYIGCKQNNYFLDEKKLIQNFSLSRKCFRAYTRLITLGLEIKYQHSFALESELALERIVAQLHLKHNIKELARLIINKVYEEKILQHKTPKVIAGAALWLAAKHLAKNKRSEYVFMDSISELTNVTTVTLRAYKNTMIPILDFLELTNELKTKIKTYQEAA